MAAEPGALWGTFSEPGNLAVGDPYTKPPATKLPRHSGKQFSTAPPPSGHAPDVYFDHAVRSLSEGAPYTDSWILERRLARAAGKPVTDKPFVLLVRGQGSNSCGPGSLDGTLGAVLLDTDASAAARRSSPPVRPADRLRNIYTTGPKTGGFGRPWQDRSLGAPPVYHSDVYNGGRLKEKEMAARAKAMSVKPFLSSAKPGGTFTPAAFLTQPAEVAGKPAGVDAGTSGAPTRGPKPAVPWRSGGPPKKGAAFCVFSQVGRDFVPCPVPEAKYHAQKAGDKPFRPVGSCHQRLSMRDVNPYATAPRPALDVDFTLL